MKFAKLFFVISILTFVASPTHAAIDDPWVWYNFERGSIGNGDNAIDSGEVVVDQSGNGRDGTFVIDGSDSIDFTQGFDGSDAPAADQVNYAFVRTPNGYFEQSEKTIVIWIDDVSHGSQKDVLGSDNQGHFFNNGQGSNFGWWDGSSSVVSASTQSGVIAFVFESTETHMYINGTMVDTGPATSDVTYNKFAIGGKWNGSGVTNAYNRPYDQYIAYDRALSTSDIQSLTNGNNPGDPISSSQTKVSVSSTGYEDCYRSLTADGVVSGTFTISANRKSDWDWEIWFSRPGRTYKIEQVNSGSVPDTDNFQVSFSDYSFPTSVTDVHDFLLDLDEKNVSDPVSVNHKTQSFLVDTNPPVCSRYNFTVPDPLFQEIEGTAKSGPNAGQPLRFEVDDQDKVYGVKDDVPPKQREEDNPLFREIIN